MADHYVVTVDYGDEIVEYEGDLFANNGTHVVLDTPTGRVWIEKAEAQSIEFARSTEGESRG